MLSSDLKSLTEAYNSIYKTDSITEITDGLVEEVIEELFEECVQEGYTIDEAAYAIEEAATEYLMELNPYAPAGSKASREYAKSTTATKRGVERKAAIKGAVERVKAKAKGVKAAAGIAGSIAKDEARRAGRAAKQAVVGAVEKKKKEVKSGIKGFLGKAAKKVASKASSVAARLGEEKKMKGEDPCWKNYEMVGTKKKGGKEVPNCVPKEEFELWVNALVEEGYDLSGYTWDEMYEFYLDEDSRRMSNKQKTASVRQNIKAFGSNFTPPNNYDPDANRGKGEVLTRKQIEKKRRKSLRQEDVEFDVFDFVQEFLCVEGYADDIDHAEWLMANIINEEAIEIILNLEDLDEGVKEIADRVVAAAKAGSARHTAAMKGAADAKKRHDASVKKLGSALKPAADTAKSAASGAAKAARGVGGAIKKGVELERKGAAAVHTLGKKMNAAKKAFTKEDLDAWLEEAYRSAEENSKRYDRARKRAAQRAAARNDARAQGKTGAVPGVGYVTPRKEKETYTDSAGKTRHAKGL